MKKILLAVLAVVSIGSQAETHAYDGAWTEIFRDQDKESSVYADYQYDANSFQRNGMTITYWEKLMLKNMNRPGNRGGWLV